MPDDDDALPIIDAHHHLWDLSLRAQPWLSEPPWIPFRYGDYTAIRHTFLLAEYAAASAGQRVVASVTMEAEWAHARLLEETAWTVARHAEAPCFPAAHVARTILHDPRACDDIAGQARSALVKAIRHKPTAAAAPDRIEKGEAGGMGDPAWRRGYAALGRHGLHFELQAPWWHVDELIDLVAAFPETAVVINHAFLPADRSPEAILAWRRALQRAAEVPQIAIKISGIGVAGRPWQLTDNRDIVRAVVDVFGPDRAMFASNFPVDGLTGTFDTIFSGFKAATSDMPHPDRLKLFHDTAIRVYRLDIAPAIA